MTTKAEAKPAAKKPRKLGLVRLKRLADELAAWGPGDVTDLVHRWETEEGAKITQVRNGAGGVQLRLAGVTATSTSGLHGAVMNWGQAARRAVLKGGAA